MSDSLPRAGGTLKMREQSAPCLFQHHELAEEKPNPTILTIPPLTKPNQTYQNLTNLNQIYPTKPNITKLTNY